MNKYLIAYTTHGIMFSLDPVVKTYGVQADNMKDAIEKLKANNYVLNIVSITLLDNSVDWKNLD